ncbi:hypothetical protein RAJCM14343_5748 [Rhodococcus aetherivorans]|uniref:Uncharacterized protein n=1 Tax=Rhodococcus aetherivorans TaxID=191292 RepID=A0ABQ0YV47_9NOCA|nr:hypothetical protein RAJCM14343_5748 [Rhodococcus aetherivorans]
MATEAGRTAIGPGAGAGAAHAGSAGARTPAPVRALTTHEDASSAPSPADLCVLTMVG